MLHEGEKQCKAATLKSTYTDVAAQRGAAVSALSTQTGRDRATLPITHMKKLELNSFQKSKINNKILIPFLIRRK